MSPKETQQWTSKNDQKSANCKSSQVPVEGRIVRRAQGHQEWVHKIVHKVENRGDKKTEVFTESHEAFLMVETGEPGLKRKDVEQYSGDRAETFFIFIICKQHPLKETANVVAHERHDARHSKKRW